jgi:hypothetical protein
VAGKTKKDDLEKTIMGEKANFINDQLSWSEESQQPRYIQFCKDAGYLWFLTTQQEYYLYSIYRQAELGEGWKSIQTLFSRKELIDKIFERLEEPSILSERAGIIRRGLKAHVEGDYIVSISVLIPQIEGLIWDIGVVSGIVSGRQNSTVKLDANGKELLNKNNNPIEWSFFDIVREIWKDPMYSLFNTKTTKDYYTDAFRHIIMHGRDDQSVQYGAIN